MNRLLMLLFVFTSLSTYSQVEFGIEDFVKPSEMLRQLRSKNMVSQKLFGHFSLNLQQEINNYDDFKQPEPKLMESLAEELNKILAEQNIYSEEVFKNIVLRELTKDQIFPVVFTFSKSSQSDFTPEDIKKVFAANNITTERIDIQKGKDRWYLQVDSKSYILEHQKDSYCVFEDRLTNIKNREHRRRLQRLLLEDAFPHLFRKMDNLQILYYRFLKKQEEQNPISAYKTPENLDNDANYSDLYLAQELALYNKQLRRMVERFQNLIRTLEYAKKNKKTVNEINEIEEKLCLLKDKISEEIDSLKQKELEKRCVNLDIEITAYKHGWMGFFGEKKTLSKQFSHNFSIGESDCVTNSFSVTVGSMSFQIKQLVVSLKDKNSIDLQCEIQLNINGADTEKTIKTSLLQGNTYGPCQIRSGNDFGQVIFLLGSVANNKDAVLAKMYQETKTNPLGEKINNYSNGFESDLENLHLGVGYVSIPDMHRVGHQEQQRWYEIDSSPNPFKHFTIMDLRKLTQDDFVKSLESENERQVLVYIHGFWNSFESAMITAAQVKYDINFPGICMLYSWPSQNTLFAYTKDESISRSSPMYFENFLKILAQSPQLDKIHIIAHSMGNRVLLSTLKSMAKEKEKWKLGHIIMAAPDVSKREFELTFQQPHILEISQSLSLYTSENDRAVSLSEDIHDIPRTGDSLPNVPIFVIDTSDVSNGFIGHTYFCESESVLRDIHRLIVKDLKPIERKLALLKEPNVYKIDRRLHVTLNKLGYQIVKVFYGTDRKLK